MKKIILRSDCGKYYAVPGPSEEDHWHRIYNASGAFLGRATYWSNRGTNTRIAFETGFGSLSATFSYPRYPSWFRRRWIKCWDCKIEDAKHLIEEHGAEVLVCYKISLTCNHCFGFRASASQLATIDAAMSVAGWKFETRQRPGCWDIACPTKERNWPHYRIVLQS